MIQNYIVALIGLLTAAYIMSQIVKAFIPARRKADTRCAGCTGCPATRRR